MDSSNFPPSSAQQNISSSSLDPVNQAHNNPVNAPALLGLDHPINNKDSILKEVDVKIGLQLLYPPSSSSLPQPIRDHSSPSIEYFFVEPYTTHVIYKNYLGLNFRPFGHAAVRYTLPGTQTSILVNISKEKGRKLVEFMDPKEWLFGVGQESHEQGGIYCRHILGIRIESITEFQIKKMHDYFLSLSENSESKLAGFLTYGSNLANRFRKLFQIIKVQTKERGNCARWTSKGLVQAGILKNSRTFPKEILMEIWKKNKKNYDKNPNCHLIYYERVASAFHRYGIQYDNGHAFSLVSLSPIGIWESFKYKDLFKMADYSVYVDKDDFARIIERDMIPKNAIRGCFG